MVVDDINPLQMRDKEKVWQKFCSFFDLSMKEFMDIQDHLLLEQLRTISDSPLSQIIMKGAHPTDMKEFRQQVSLTKYQDYKPYIGHCQEDYLSEKPICWARTSGRGGDPKWVPYTQIALDWISTIGVTSLIMACASRRGEVRIESGVRIMQNVAPLPYFSGVAGEEMVKKGYTRMIPPLDKCKNQSFEERIQEGFRMALLSPIEVLASLTAVLIKMGESFTENQGKLKISSKMIHPRILIRLISAFYRSKREKRPMLPKDLWPLKGLICYGMDTSAYRQRLKYYWGREPLEIYSSTECIMLALQCWNKKGLTFLPFSGFLEFIPEAEWIKSKYDKNYQPYTILMDEVRAGNLYEVVFTSFHGMPFLRYRLGDLIKVVDLNDVETGVQLPQIVFQCRGDDIIDINGFARLDEKTIWQAINSTDVKFNGWSARKEYTGDKPFVHVYLEPRDGIDTTNLGQRIHEHILDNNGDYRDLNEMLGMLPVRVTILRGGTYQAYYDSKRKAGADLSHLKPPQMNILERDLEELLIISKHGD